MKITSNTVVFLHCKIKSLDGNIIDSTDKNNPIAYLHGHEHPIAGIERKLEGKSVGDRISVTLGPEDAYGVRHDELIQDVLWSDFVSGDGCEVGSIVEVTAPNGCRVGKVIKIDNDRGVFTIDMNHLLAGQTLVFNILIVKVYAANEDDIRLGCVRGTFKCL